MRRSFVLGLLVLMVGVGAVAFAASPFYAAWTLREAIRTGDTETVNRKIDWEPFRASLRRAIANNAGLVPDVRAASRRIRPTLWQRVKRVFGASLIDRFIETHVTPTGLPKLYADHVRKRKQNRLSRSSAPRTDRLLRAGFHPATRSQSGPAEAGLDWKARLQRFVRRLSRAEFLDWTTVEIEVRDQVRSDRSFIATLQLIGTQWKLTHLDIKTKKRRARDLMAGRIR
ncbi:MAG: DUF2939 domain-containing protein [Pseudomonadota bacterium]